MDKFTLTLERLNDTTVRATLREDENRGAFADGATAAKAISLLANYCAFDVDVQTRELSVPEPSTLGLARDVAIDADNIKALIEAAYDKDECVQIDYVGADGTRTYERVIEPKNRFHKRGYSDEEYVNAYDYKSGEPRSFRLDRIQRAEAMTR